MAVAVSYHEFKPADSREDLIRMIEEAPAEHAEAVLAAYALLQQLHRQRPLGSCYGGLKTAGNTIIDHVVDIVSAKESVDALEADGLAGKDVRKNRRRRAVMGTQERTGFASFSLVHR